MKLSTAKTALLAGVSFVVVVAAPIGNVRGGKGHGGDDPKIVSEQEPWNDRALKETSRSSGKSAKVASPCITNNIGTVPPSDDCTSCCECAVGLRQSCACGTCYCDVVI